MYIVVEDWMIKKLRLSGNKLLVYALVYGFSRDGKSEFKGGIGYAAKFLGVTENTIRNAVKELESSGLVCKRLVVIAGKERAVLKALRPCKNCTPAKIAPLQKLSETPAKIEGSSNNSSIYRERDTRARGFTPPTVEDVKAYCLERRNGIDPESFVAFYSSKGWMIGKNKMTDWKAAVITWEKKRRQERPPEQKKKKTNSFHNFQEREYDYGALKKLLQSKGRV